MEVYTLFLHTKSWAPINRAANSQFQGRPGWFWAYSPHVHLRFLPGALVSSHNPEKMLIGWLAILNSSNVWMSVWKCTLCTVMCWCIALCSVFQLLVIDTPKIKALDLTKIKHLDELINYVQQMHTGVRLRTSPQHNGAIKFLVCCQNGKVMGKYV